MPCYIQIPQNNLLFGECVNCFVSWTIQQPIRFLQLSFPYRFVFIPGTRRVGWMNQPSGYKDKQLNLISNTFFIIFYTWH